MIAQLVAALCGHPATLPPTVSIPDRFLGSGPSEGGVWRVRRWALFLVFRQLPHLLARLLLVSLVMASLAGSFAGHSFSLGEQLASVLRTGVGDLLEKW